MKNIKLALLFASMVSFSFKAEAPRAENHNTFLQNEFSQTICSEPSVSTGKNMELQCYTFTKLKTPNKPMEGECAGHEYPFAASADFYTVAFSENARGGKRIFVAENGDTFNQVTLLSRSYYSKEVAQSPGDAYFSFVVGMGGCNSAFKDGAAFCEQPLTLSVDEFYNRKEKFGASGDTFFSTLEDNEYKLVLVK